MNAYEQKNKEYQERILGRSEFRKILTGESIVIVGILGGLLGLAIGL